jgi:hypothetical protein
MFSLFFHLFAPCFPAIGKDSNILFLNCQYPNQFFNEKFFCTKQKHICHIFLFAGFITYMQQYFRFLGDFGRQSPKNKFSGGMFHERKKACLVALHDPHFLASAGIFPRLLCCCYALTISRH